MEWLNYHHLYYFWKAAREGGIARAAEKLKVSHPALSVQIKQLEQRFGEKLFEKSGRQLVLTDIGKLVYRYAEDIFALGRELNDVIEGGAARRFNKFTVGVCQGIPKLIAKALLKPAWDNDFKNQVQCREESFASLLKLLSAHEVDMIVSDTTIPASSSVKAYSHLLGESGTSFFGSARLVKMTKAKFPKLLNGMPILLPSNESMQRVHLDQWMHEDGIKPLVIAEFDDSALLKSFGQEGIGFFSAPTVIEKEVCRQYQVKVVGRVNRIKERFYAISIERKLKHPLVNLVCKSARRDIFN